MKLHPEDPRLTACALGELSEEEAAAVGNAVEKNPVLQTEIEEIAGLRDYLAATLAMPGEKLTKPQHDAVMRAARVISCIRRPASERSAAWHCCGGYRWQAYSAEPHQQTLLRSLSVSLSRCAPRPMTPIAR